MSFARGGRYVCIPYLVLLLIRTWATRKVLPQRASPPRGSSDAMFSSFCHHERRHIYGAMVSSTLLQSHVHVAESDMTISDDESESTNKNKIWPFASVDSFRGLLVIQLNVMIFQLRPQFALPEPVV